MYDNNIYIYIYLCARVYGRRMFLMNGFSGRLLVFCLLFWRFGRRRRVCGTSGRLRERVGRRRGEGGREKQQSESYRTTRESIIFFRGSYNLTAGYGGDGHGVYEAFIKKYWYPPGCDFEGPLVLPSYRLYASLSPWFCAIVTRGLPDRYLRVLFLFFTHNATTVTPEANRQSKYIFHFGWVVCVAIVVNK